MNKPMECILCKNKYLHVWDFGPNTLIKEKKVQSICQKHKNVLNVVLI